MKTITKILTPPIPDRCCLDFVSSAASFRPVESRPLDLVDSLDFVGLLESNILVPFSLVSDVLLFFPCVSGVSGVSGLSGLSCVLFPSFCPLNVVFNLSLCLISRVLLAFPFSLGVSISLIGFTVSDFFKGHLKS